MGWVLDNHELSDEQLAAESAREGSDGPAFVTLLRRFERRIWQTCYRLLGNTEDAHDAAQEVFVRLFLHRATFQGRSKYSTWAYGVAVRTCLTFRRGRGRRQRRERIAGEQARQKQERKYHAAQESTLDLHHILEGLDEEDRAMLILKYSDGHSYEDLSEMFDLSISACKMRISRARGKLRQMYPDHAIDKSPERE